MHNFASKYYKNKTKLRIMTKLKNLMLLLAVAIVGAAALTACSDDNDDNGKKLTPPVTLSLTAADVTDVSASVTVTPSDTGRWFAAIYPTTYVQGKTDADLVKTNSTDPGFAAKLQKGSKTFTYNNLDPTTSYTVVAFGWNGQEAGTVARQEFTTEAKRIPQEVSRFFDVNYWADVYHNGFHNYMVLLGDVEHKDINFKSAGTMYTLSLYTKNAPGSDLMPEAGHYTMISTDATEPVDHCIELNESGEFTTTRFVSETDYTLKTTHITDAEADITKNDDGTWSISATIELEDGTKKNLVYTGQVTVLDKSFKGYTGPTISSDVEYTADYTAGYNYAGTQFEIMDGGDPNAEDADWMGRNRLTIYLAAEKDANGNNVPPIGTFSVSDEDKPGSVLRGEYVDLGSGVEGPEGTYYFLWEKKTFKQYYAFVQKGSVTIAKGQNEGEYVVDANFLTHSGHTVKAHYTGTFPTTFPTAAQAKGHKAAKARKAAARKDNKPAPSAKTARAIKAALQRMPK